jgi:hypothetical protein
MLLYFVRGNALLYFEQCCCILCVAMLLYFVRGNVVVF